MACVWVRKLSVNLYASTPNYATANHYHPTVPHICAVFADVGLLPPAIPLCRLTRPNLLYRDTKLCYSPAAISLSAFIHKEERPTRVWRSSVQGSSHRAQD